MVSGVEAHGCWLPRGTVLVLGCPRRPQAASTGSHTLDGGPGWVICKGIFREVIPLSWNKHRTHAAAGTALGSEKGIPILVPTLVRWAIEHLKWSQSKLKCMVTIKYALDFEDLIPPK